MRGELFPEQSQRVPRFYSRGQTSQVRFEYVGYGAFDQRVRNGLKSPGIAKTDRAYTRLSGAGVDLCARLPFGETLTM